MEVGYIQLPQWSDPEYVRHHDQCFIQLAESHFGRLVYNETLRIVSNAEMKVRYRNSTYTISVGENIMYDLILYKGTKRPILQGTGKITLIQQRRDAVDVYH